MTDPVGLFTPTTASSYMSSVPGGEPPYSVNTTLGAFQWNEITFDHFATFSAGPPVPEPSIFILVGIGAISVLGYAWRKKRDSEGRLKGTGAYIG